MGVAPRGRAVVSEENVSEPRRWEKKEEEEEEEEKMKVRKRGTERT